MFKLKSTYLTQPYILYFQYAIGVSIFKLEIIQSWKSQMLSSLAMSGFDTGGHM